MSFEKVIDDMELSDRLDLIWNCDESGLLHKPPKLKIISKEELKARLVSKLQIGTKISIP